MRQHLTVSNLLMEIDNLKNPGQSSTADDEGLLEDIRGPSDNLCLLQDGVNFTQNNHGHVVGGPTSVCIGDEVSKPITEIKIKRPTQEDEATVVGNEASEELKEKFVIVTRERNEARTELEFLKKNLSMKDYAPHHENAMSWLGYCEPFKRVTHHGKQFTVVFINFYMFIVFISYILAKL